MNNSSPLLLQVGNDTAGRFIDQWQGIFTLSFV